MVAPQTEKPAPEEVAAVNNPHPVGTPEYFLWETTRLDAEVREGRVSPLKANQATKYWVNRAELLGIKLAEVANRQMDPIRRLLGNPDTANHTEESLLEIKAAIEAAKTLNATERTVKKKWLQNIDLTIELQHLAVENPIFLTLYVVRCQKTNKVLSMEELHVSFFEAWCDPNYQNSLEEAPPGTGKTTCLYGMILWEYRDDQKLRQFFVTFDFATARLRLATVRQYIESGRYRAIAPNVHMDYSMPNNTDQFTLIRENRGSQDPSMRALGSTTAVQGAGVDRINADDLCDIKVRREPSTRQKIDEHFHGIIMQRLRTPATDRVRMICTPWHADDTPGRLIQEFRKGNMPDWRVDKHPIHEDAAGRPIPLVTRPGRAQLLATFKATKPVLYACCFQLDTRASTLRTLEKLVFWDSEGGTSPYCPPRKREYCANFLKAVKSSERWTVCDPASGGANDTGSVDFAISARGRSVITAADFFQANATEAQDRICNNVTANASDKVLLEAQGGMKGLANLWADYLIKRLGEDYRSRVLFTGTRMHKNGNPVGQNIAKGERFYNCAPYLQNGVVMFPGKWAIVEGAPRLVCVEDPALRKLHDQLLNYPDVTQDAGIDCLSMFVNYNLHRLVRTIKSLRMEREKKTSGPMSVLTQIHMERRKKQREARKARPKSAEERFFSFAAA